MILREPSNGLGPATLRVLGPLCALFASFATAGAAGAGAQGSTGTGGGVDDASLAFSACTIGNRTTSLPAECASVSVPMDPDLPDGARLELAIARLPARERDARDDPLVLVAGGPGQSALQTFPSIITAFRHVNRERDLILVDQRGTGDSRPLDCADPEPPGTPAASGDPDPVAEAREAARRCLASLDEDTTLFTTSVAVQDLDAVRRALGLATMNLYGVSYGTRVALHYARRFPASVRSLILDAVVPPGTPLGADIAPVAQRAMDDILQRCLDDSDCGGAFPGIDTRTAALLARLQREPVRIRYEDIADGRPRDTELGRAELAVTLRLLSYSAWGASLLPSMLDDAIETAHFAPFARQTDLQSRALAEALATGLHYSVICTEDLPFTNAPAALAAARSTFLGELPLAAQIAACEDWPRGRIDADFHRPLALDMPTLILSGDADPVTPPAYGERAAAMLGEDVVHVINTGQGHTQASLGCVPSLMATFLRAGTGADLSLDCLARLTPPPFFLDANGPRP